MSVKGARQGETAGAEVAYEAIAPVYDDFTHHHNYEAWVTELLSYLEPLGLRGRRLLDVACGTGKSFIPMLERGWEVTASDISPAMVRLAREKVGERAALSVADMRRLPHYGEFDLVWCLDDAINYLADADELERALRAMRPNLAPGHGLLLFDLNALGTYRTFFAEEVEMEINGRRLLWHGLASPEMEPGGTAEAVFEVEPLDGGEPPIPAETHRQRHFTEAETLAALERSGYECLEVHGLFTDGVLRKPFDDARHSKAVYIARAARP
ncbi:MAG TPA: class I SAM-dependent methyltransferase [Solirubrobacterales bacterium]|nr:class I SAM-dependent methyltransferase [Solirubrobacterales bacterium]